MKKLINILVLIVVLVACKQELKTDSTKKDITKKAVAKTQPQIDQKKEQTIEEFLKELQIAVRDNDVLTIEKSLRFPFEFNWGGESSFYNNYQEIKDDSGKFSYILEAKSIEKDGDLFIITYEEPEDEEYFVSFIAEKVDGSFKLTSFMQPH